MRQHVTNLLQQALQNLQYAQKINQTVDITKPITVDHVTNKLHGDLASNVALTLAKPCGMNPRALAQLVVEALPTSSNITKVEIAGPGFINFFLSANSHAQLMADILRAGNTFGTINIGQGAKVQVEFVSANPTGPLHVGHGRGAVIGDCLCRLLTATGYNVTAEFYYNDAGQQINNLALSVQARAQGLTPEHANWPKDGYAGSYISEIAEAYLHDTATSTPLSDLAPPSSLSGVEERGIEVIRDLNAIKNFAVAYLRREQDLDLRAFDVHFDVYYLESSLYTNGKVDAVVQQLIANGHTYEDGGALWLETTKFGDDKDRVMRKSDGGYTYFVPDVAYHLDKWQRGFGIVINEQGSDHHSTITHVRAGLQALEVGIPQAWPEYVLHQMVTVMRNGAEVRLSKRAGSYVTLRDLIDEVGLDATRYFLVARAAGSQITFDIDLACSKSNENPVYYIQYAFARINSIMTKITADNITEDSLKSTILAKITELAPQLVHDNEQALLNRLGLYSQVLQDSATLRAPHVMASYLRELAGDFHAWYNTCQVTVDDTNLRDARLALCLATQQIISNGLGLLGISCPLSM